jgi:hypothetical protein
MPSNESGSGMSAQGSSTLILILLLDLYLKLMLWLGRWGSWGGEGWGKKDLTNVTLDPGSWSLDNYGQLLVATVRNGATFTWNPNAVAAHYILEQLLLLMHLQNLY